MAGKAFVDSNVFIYSLSAEDPVKRARAREVLLDGPIVISTQVLQECAHVLRRRMGDSPDRAADRLRPLLKFEVIPITVDLILEAWAIAGRYGFGPYDAAIVAAARSARCAILWTEDLSHGQVIDNVTIRNPFV